MDDNEPLLESRVGADESHVDAGEIAQSVIEHANAVLAMPPLSDWMAALSPQQRTRPLAQTQIIGAHNAASWRVCFREQLHSPRCAFGGPRVGGRLRGLSRWLFPLPPISTVLCRFVACQSHSLASLLADCGVRWLDLRVAVDPATERWHISHTFTNGFWADAAADIAHFLVSLCPPLCALS